MAKRMVLVRGIGPPAAVVLAVCCMALRTSLDAQEWWPDASLREFPPEVLSIPSLSDAGFLDAIRRMKDVIQVEPTNRGNFESRVALARRYYNALQADGNILPWFSLGIINAMQAWSDDPDDLFLGYAKMFDRCFLGLCFIHEHSGELGAVEILAPVPKRLEARAYTTLKIRYRVGTIPMEAGSKLRFSPNWQHDGSPVQFTRPLYPGYTSVHASNPDVKLAVGHDFWQSVYGSPYPPGAPRPLITVRQGRLKEGDTITILIGDRTRGGPGVLTQTFATDRFPLRFEASFRGTGVGFVPVGEPVFSVHGSSPHHIRVVAPSTVRRDASFVVRASIEDQYFNRATHCPERLTLWIRGRRIAAAGHVKGDEAVFHFEDLAYPADRSGPLYFEVSDGDRSIRGRSNPVHLAEPDEPMIYWGDLHCHEGYTDGCGTAEWVMRYARDVGFLDFVALTGHDILMSEFHQRDVLRVTEKYHRPRRFVTFKGYEWTQQYRHGGHHNVFYRDAGQRIIPCYQARSVSALYRRQREVNDPSKVLIIPHAHNPGDWHVNDPGMERLVEIYSQHGGFEWFGRRYLANGFHVGLMGASDDHSGHPGNRNVRKRQYGAVCAVMARELTREAVFDALLARRVYGTTLARIYLDMAVEGAPMGSEIVLPRRHPPMLHVSGRISGTAPIARIVAVCNGGEVEIRNALRCDDGRAETHGGVLRMMIGSSNEPEGDAVQRPLGSVRLWGRVSFKHARIRAITPVGNEGAYDDRFSLTSDRRMDFACMTHGDQDGVLIELDQWRDEDACTIALYRQEADASIEKFAAWRMPLWGEIKLDAGETVQCRLGDLNVESRKMEIGERSALLLEKVDAMPARHLSFDMDVRDHLKGEGEDYLYIRAEQIDGETAWSSPVWVQWQ